MLVVHGARELEHAAIDKGVAEQGDPGGQEGLVSKVEVEAAADTRVEGGRCDTCESVVAAERAGDEGGAVPATCRRGGIG